MKKIILLLIMFINLSAIAQPGKKYFEKGILLFEKKDFRGADSLFKIALQYSADKEVFYYLALTCKELNDTDGYCTMLKKSYQKSHKQALKDYCYNCVVGDLSEYDKEVVFLTSFIYIEKNDTCNYCKCLQIAADKGIETALTFYNQDCIKARLSNANCSYLKDSIYVPQFKDLYTGVVESMPNFIGGDEMLFKFLVMNLRYPAEALKKNIQGKVSVSFIVDKSGDVIFPKIEKGIGGGADEEALRIVKIMPKWQPAKSSGNPVSVRFELPIIFKLN